MESDGSLVSSTFTQDSGGNGLTLTNGANFYTVVAIHGQSITSVEISTDAGGGYAGLRQLRVGGVVPEPATWALFAFASAVLMAVKRVQLD